MIKQHYTGSSRRAMNIIWNAAQDYGWDSPFLAFHQNGDADDYMNMVIGLSAKWLDAGRITDFFERLGTGPTIDEASSVLWLGIENCVFGKETPERPCLENMRKARAEEFFRVSGMLSEQQMSFMSIRAYDQELIRWSRVLGRRVFSAGSGAKALADKLEFSPSWDTDEVLEHMQQILRESFRLSLNDAAGAGRAGRGLLKVLTGAFSKHAAGSEDLLVLRRGTGSGDAKRSVHITHSLKVMPDTAKLRESRSYIEASFGPCMYTEAEMKIIEGTICRENDASCRLWFTDVPAAGTAMAEKAASGSVMSGEGSSGSVMSGEGSSGTAMSGEGSSGTAMSGEVVSGLVASGEDTSGAQVAEYTGREKDKPGRSSSHSKEILRLKRDQAAQRKRNEEYLQENRFSVMESIRNLSAQADTIFQSYLRYLPSRSKAGRLDGSSAWRARTLRDTRIFLTDSDIDEASVCVDLLLDASSSRINSQEMIAAQALVISRSFEECHIPVRVTAFRSLKGYTVLQRLKEFGDRRGDGIMKYYAGGWNRDALCLKAMEYLIGEEQKSGSFMTRVLLVLTDASPNDSTPLPPKEGSLFPREYEGDEPVRDAGEAVRSLISDGVYTGALFYGASSHLEQVHQIYSQQYVRVKTLNQLPDAVCELLRRSLAQAQTRSM